MHRISSAITCASSRWILATTLTFPLPHTPIQRHKRQIWTKPDNPSAEVGDRATAEKLGSGRVLNDSDGRSGGKG